MSEHRPYIVASLSNTHERVILSVRCDACTKVSWSKVMSCPELKTALQRLDNLIQWSGMDPVNTETG